ncbi:MAG TPA: FMN-binding glutamate synthase family protein, partial [Arthrobacter sp.]|nr:FMN-binding glutamate synthase family protein [Arthrobacter sp.]
MTITSVPLPTEAAVQNAPDIAALGLRESATFDRATIADIQRAAATGVYDIRGWGAKRKVPHFDDLLFLGASMSRYPLEGYREKCDTDVV